MTIFSTMAVSAGVPQFENLMGCAAKSSRTEVVPAEATATRVAAERADENLIVMVAELLKRMRRKMDVKAILGLDSALKLPSSG
jgi:hypothetical protein